MNQDGQQIVENEGTNPDPEDFYQGFKEEQGKRLAEAGLEDDGDDWKIPETSWSENGAYGTTIDWANWRYFLKRYPTWVKSTTGNDRYAYIPSSKAASIPQAVVDEIARTIGDLKENYPVADDELLSRHEYELQEEAMSEVLKELVTAWFREYGGLLEDIGYDPDEVKDAFIYGGFEDSSETPEKQAAAREKYGTDFVSHMQELLAGHLEDAEWEYPSAISAYLTNGSEKKLMAALKPTDILELAYPERIQARRDREESDKNQMKFPFWDTMEGKRVLRQMARAVLDGEGYDLSCLMAMIPEETAAKLHGWVHQHLGPVDVYVDDDVKGYEDESHVTVKYGFIDPVPTQELLKVIASTNPFEITLLPARLFEKEKYDVLVLGVSSPELMQFNRLASEAAPVYDTYPTYTPHLTLAYVKKGRADHLVGHTPFDDQARMGKIDMDALKVTINRVIFSPKGNDDQKLLFDLGKQAGPP